MGKLNTEIGSSTELTCRFSGLELKVTLQSYSSKTHNRCTCLWTVTLLSYFQFQTGLATYGLIIVHLVAVWTLTCLGWNGKLTAPERISTADVSSGVRANLTLETSAFEILYGGQFTVSPQLIISKSNYCRATLTHFANWNVQNAELVSCLRWIQDLHLVRLKQV